MSDITAFDRVSGIINDKGFTPEQLRAIMQDGDIIVSAGAGSGKTTVMIARIINKLLNGASLNEMLIVTFTRTAAQDMRIKLNEKLTALAKHHDADIRAAALLALEQMPTCNIGTLHSYCQRIVKQYFFAAEIDPAAVVCEDGEARLIKAVAVKAAVERAQKSGDDRFAVISDMLKTRRSDDGIADTVTDIMDFALSTSDPKGYLTNIKADVEYAPLLDELLIKRKAELLSHIDDLKIGLVAEGMQKFVDLMGEFVDYLELRTDKFTRKPSAKTETQKALGDEFDCLRAECKKYRDIAVDAAKARSIESSQYVKALCLVALDAASAYADSKAKQGKIDYSDLEHGAFRVLSDDKCLSEIMRGVRYVFIDEFQDVNPLQNDIADKLSAGSAASGYTDGAEMFVVGDVKQSIYGFRRCSPSHFKKAIERADGDPRRTHIALTHNFRSSDKVVEFVNRVFDGVMTEDFGGVDYSSAGQRLVCGRPDIKNGDASFVIVTPEYAVERKVDKSERFNGEYSVKTAAFGAEKHDPQAVFIANSIAEYIDENTKKSEIALGEFKLGDIAVLMRTADAELCSAIAYELKERGIKYVFGRKSSVKTYPEAVALVDIARCVDNRLDDVALYTAMRLPMGGFSDRELLEIAEVGGGLIGDDVTPLAVGGKRYAFMQKAMAYKGTLRPRIDKFFELLNDFTKIAKTSDCGTVFGEITSRTEYFQYVYETGGQASAVQSLIDYAAARRCDLHAFLDYYDNADFDIECDGGGDAVNITTIHSSKGLEYDFVIVCDLQHKFNERDNVGRVIVSENGVFAKIPDMSSRTLSKSIPYIVANMSASAVTRQEELRLLYVALTRAKKRLICCCKADSPVEYPEPSSAKSMLDFMKNITPSSPDVCDYSADSAEAVPLDVCIEAEIAVRERIKTANSYTERHKYRDLPIKTCVTRLAHEAESIDGENEEPNIYMPVLTDDDRDPSDGDGDARLRGTAYHRAMELVDFIAPDFDKVKAECENADLVDFSEIARAVKAVKPLIDGAAAYAKEKYFIVDADAGELYGNSEYNGAGVLVQGVIDLLILERDGTAVIVDYKTGDPKRLINEGYRTQLALYKKAVEKATGIKVKRSCLYSFASGEFIDFQ